MTDAHVERLTAFGGNDLADLCDAAEEGIKAGGGFGWIDPPPRSVMEAYWQGTLLVPERAVFVGRLDGVIAASMQLVRPPRNAEVWAHAANLTTFFVAPWARGHGLSPLLLDAAENEARREGFALINLDVRETQKRAIEVFEEHGYQRWGVHEKYARVGGKYVSGFFYTKDLGA